MYLCCRRTNISVGVTGKASPKTEPAICRCLHRHREEGLSMAAGLGSPFEVRDKLPKQQPLMTNREGQRILLFSPSQLAGDRKCQHKPITLHKSATQFSFDWRMFQWPFRDADLCKQNTNLLLIVPTYYNGVDKKLEFYSQGFASLALGFTPKILWGQQFCCLIDLRFHSDSAIRPEDAKTRMRTRKANSALGSNTAPAATLMYHLRLETD